MSLRRTLIIALTLGWAAATAAAPLEATLTQLKQQWDHVQYELPKGEKVAAFDHLAGQWEALAAVHPARPEPRVWEAITLASEAGAKGGLGALSLVKQARDLLKEAEPLAANGRDDSLFTTLGSLYDQVPGWPIGFGDKKQAKRYLEKAIALNPTGLDANYFYGQYLAHHHQYAEAATYLHKALKAPARPGRAVADAGRRKEVEVLLAKVEAKAR